MSLPVDSSTSGNAQLNQNPDKKTANTHLSTNNLSLDYMSLHFSDAAVRSFYDPNTMKFTSLGHEVFGKWREVCSKIPSEQIVRPKPEKKDKENGFIKI